MGVAILNVFIVSGLFWGHVDRVILLTWAAVLLAASAARWLLTRHALKHNHFADTHWAVALSFVGGVCWGLPLYFLGTDASPVLSYLVIFMVAGMSAAAAMSFSSHLPVVLAVNVPLLSMTACRFLEMGGVVNNAMAGIIMLYLVSTTMLARRNRAVLEVRSAIRCAPRFRPRKFAKWPKTCAAPSKLPRLPLSRNPASSRI